MERLAKAEQNIEVLLKERPDQRANLMAWKAGATPIERCAPTRRARPRNSRRTSRAREGFTAAANWTGNDGVAAITGGSLAIFADRLPAAHRAAAWTRAYDNYSLLWKQQGAGIEKMPVHFKGEVCQG